MNSWSALHGVNFATPPWDFNTTEDPTHLHSTIIRDTPPDEKWTILLSTDNAIALPGAVSGNEEDPNLGRARRRGGELTRAIV